MAAKPQAEAICAHECGITLPGVRDNNIYYGFLDGCGGQWDPLMLLLAISAWQTPQASGIARSHQVNAVWPTPLQSGTLHVDCYAATAAQKSHGAHSSKENR